MASWQARVATFFIRRLVRTPLRRSPTAKTLRKVFNANQHPVPRGCAVTEEIIGGVRSERVVADGVPQLGTLLYLHGGAFVACSPVTHRPLTSWFARQGWTVIVPDYRLAPENRFPAQIEDVSAVYRGLLDRGVDPLRAVVAGDSAGGNLTLTLCLSLRAAKLPQPAAIALFSPVTDLTWSGESIQSNSERCAMFSHDILPAGTELYLGAHDPRDPLASPYYADLAGLPPMLFHVSGDEILRDDSVRMAERAKQTGIEVQIRIWPGVSHVWQLMHRWIPEGRESLGLTQDFLRAHISK